MRGNKGFRSEASMIITEYFERKDLAMMGIATFLGDLDIIKAQCFSIISNKLNEIREDDMKKANSKIRRR
jgi:hypothetical protein